nr:hypothetical protein [Tanacetum cinerariifolium]
MVFAGRSMFLLVVLIPAGSFVPAGRHTSAGGSISIDPYFPKHVYRVVKALYGLHQAPRGCYGLCWWLRVPDGRHTSAGGFIST